MQRETIEARPNKNERLKERLFNYLEDSSELPYWQDEAYYSFSQAEIEEVEKATEELYHMCVKAVDHVIKDNRLGEFGVPAHMHDYVTLSFNRQDPTIYGRFDFSYDGTKPPKMLEYNADTPTSLYEAAILQWDWLEDRRIQNPGRFSNSDQFNGLHEALVDTWKRAVNKYNFPEIIHFTCMTNNIEDVLTTSYMEETAYQTGIKTHFMDISTIGRTAMDFVDDKDQVIKGLFKLYPWEFMFKEEYGSFATQDRTGFIEPVWKSLISNKNILPVLWELFPGHPNLLPAFRDANAFEGQPYVKKAVLGREGAGITIVNGGQVIASDNSDYDSTGFIYQGFEPLPNFDGKYPVVGSWTIDGDAKGMSIREDNSLITRNGSRFVPHMFKPA